MKSSTQAVLATCLILAALWGCSQEMGSIPVAQAAAPGLLEVRVHQPKVPHASSGHGSAFPLTPFAVSLRLARGSVLGIQDDEDIEQTQGRHGSHR